MTVSERPGWGGEEMRMFMYLLRTSYLPLPPIITNLSSSSFHQNPPPEIQAAKPYMSHVDAPVQFLSVYLDFERTVCLERKSLLCELAANDSIGGPGWGVEKRWEWCSYLIHTLYLPLNHSTSIRLLFSTKSSPEM